MKKRILIVTILLLTIGFASIATNVILNGNVNIGYGKFIIVFTEAIVGGEDVSSQAISKSGTELTFTTKELTSIGDTSTLNFIATNTSKQYDANVVFDCKGIGENTEYYEIEKEFPNILKARTSENGVVRVRIIKPSLEKIEGRIKCTLDFEAVELEAKQLDTGEIYQDEILNGADPVLSDELIPVTIADDGRVTKANIHTRWYSYTDKEWANAVILADDAPTYEIYDEIPEEMIESYFVWVPRYRYKLFNMGNYTSLINGQPIGESIAKTIEVEFETKESVTNDSVEGECTTPLASGASGTCKVGDYMTHPAFINFDVNGLWVGKYKVGYKGAKSVPEAEINSADSSKVVIKPNMYSWRYRTVYNTFLSSYNYARNLDSHMMKNTEWGAVTFLSQSIYGINNEIRNNNNTNYLTGYSAVNAPTCLSGTFSSCNEEGTDSFVTRAYNTEIGYLASSTGNITGIYDMNSNRLGTSVAAFVSGYYGESGFTASTIQNFLSKYIDVYKNNTTLTSFNNRILGDAMGEMGPFYTHLYNGTVLHNYNHWYLDISHLPDSEQPWTVRGSGGGMESGKYSIGRGTGSNHMALANYIVLAI